MPKPEVLQQQVHDQASLLNAREVLALVRFSRAKTPEQEHRAMNAYINAAMHVEDLKGEYVGQVPADTFEAAKTETLEAVGQIVADFNVKTGEIRG